jgi:UDP-galactopyranose mutase
LATGTSGAVSKTFDNVDLVIVGAGFFGLTIAECATRELGLRVLVVEKRDHIGGNAHSRIDPDTGDEVHVYGSHIFHTNSEEVWHYSRRFTEFTAYRHHVFTRHAGRVFSMPITFGTICEFFGRAFTPDEARALLSGQALELANRVPENLEEKAISLIGRPLYEAFIRGYTAKQWQTDPRDLPADTITRLPVRYTFDACYFADSWQGLPARGYFRLFERMAANPLIRIATNTDFFAIRDRLPRVPLIYSGPIDRYFDYRLGHLGWRTLDFEREVVQTRDFQGTAVMNYADAEVPFTRIHEFRHLHPERRAEAARTVIFREYSRRAGLNDEPYYPINTAADRRMYDGYRALAAAEPNVIFGGRLGSYRYLDMHQAIGAALKVFAREIGPHIRDHKPITPRMK